MRMAFAYRYSRFLTWPVVLVVLAFGNGPRTGEAATLWVPPAEAMSESQAGRWAATQSGHATFTFALPDDLADFIGARVVLLPNAAEWVTYNAYITLSQEGLGHDHYTDDIQVVEPFELLADQLTEFDVSGLVPPQDVLEPGRDYLTIRFTVKAYGSKELSSTARILGLRLEYLEVNVTEAYQAEAINGSTGISSLSSVVTVSEGTNSSSSLTDSVTEIAAFPLAGQARSGSSMTVSAAPVIGMAGKSLETLADTKFHVVGDIGLSSPFVGIHEWALGSTGVVTPTGVTGYFFIEDLTTADLRFAIDQDTGLVQAGDFLANNAGFGIVPNPSYALTSSGLARFEGLNGGRFEFSTPGGWPGIIGYSPNGYRREIALKNDYMWILAGDSSAAPDATHGITIRNNGDVGIGTATPAAKLTVAGRTATSVLEITGGSDLSEGFQIHAPEDGVALTPGMVVSIDPGTPGVLKVSRESYDRRVAGVISGAGDVKPGLLMGQEGTLANGHNPVALTGRVYCLADATYGAIQPGDLLTTSSTPGHAMKVTDYARAQGAILGKAMTSLTETRDLVLVLVTLQ